MFEQWVIDAEIMYDKGITFTEIGKVFGKNRQVVAKHIKAKKENRVIINHNNMNRNMNNDVFEDINCEAKAYWLGFMYADGYVSTSRNEIGISLKEEDLVHVEKFKRFLGAKNKIQRKVKDGRYVSYNMSLRSKKIKSDLISKGCLPQKSKVINFPNSKIIPSHLLKHFIRGYVDGDGSITTSNQGSNVSLEILGNESFLNGLIQVELFERNKLYYFNHTDIKRVSYSGNKAMSILNYIYDNATIYLERKYARYQQWVTPS